MMKEKTSKHTSSLASSSQDEISRLSQSGIIILDSSITSICQKLKF